MVQLVFQFYEVENLDYTGVEISLFDEDRCLIAQFANFQDLGKRQHWSNQSESFALPDLKLAKEFVTSSGYYHERFGTNVPQENTNEGELR
jgi:hypothetical protein